MPLQRYVVVEIEGKWFVMDRKYPEEYGPEYADKAQAELDARVWNIITGCG